MSPVIYSNMLYTSHYMKQEKESFHDSCILSDNCILSKQWPHWHPIQLNSHTTFHPGKLYYFLQLFLYSLNPNLGVVFSVVKCSSPELNCHVFYCHPLVSMFSVLTFILQNLLHGADWINNKKAFWLND